MKSRNGNTESQSPGFSRAMNPSCNFAFVLQSEIRNPKSKIRNLSTAFTLVELMVVVVIIGLVLASALPTISGLFNAGADEQAYNLLAAQVASARALAITSGTYAGVHVQMADAVNEELTGGPFVHPDIEGKCYSAILIYRHDVGRFVLADGHQPIPMPGNIAFGKLTTYFVHVSNYRNLNNDADLEDFTTFTIVFNPQGQVVTSVEGNDVEVGNFIEYDGSDIDFNVSRVLFWDGSLSSDAQDQLNNACLWAPPVNNPAPGVSAVTMFDYRILRGLADGDARADYLNQAGQFLCLNLYTGQFFYRY